MSKVSVTFVFNFFFVRDDYFTDLFTAEVFQNTNVLKFELLVWYAEWYACLTF